MLRRYSSFVIIINYIIINKAPETGEWVCGVGVGVRRGFAWCVRSQVVGIATRRGARDESARPAHARPAQAMRLTANTKRKP